MCGPRNTIETLPLRTKLGWMTSPLDYRDRFLAGVARFYPHLPPIRRVSGRLHTSFTRAYAYV